MSSFNKVIDLLIEDALHSPVYQSSLEATIQLWKFLVIGENVIDQGPFRGFVAEQGYQRV